MAGSQFRNILPTGVTADSSPPVDEQTQLGGGLVAMNPKSDGRWRFMRILLIIARYIVLVDVALLIGFTIGIDLVDWNTRSYYIISIVFCFLTYVITTLTINPWYKWMAYGMPPFGILAAIIGCVFSFLGMIQIADIYVKFNVPVTPVRDVLYVYAPGWQYMASELMFFINAIILGLLAVIHLVMTIYIYSKAVVHVNPIDPKTN